ncbi:MAG: Uncharacterized protein CEN90_131 [Parcubacteria group bacterium Licking1014_17]|nr:MAG: Uncharacterized protein CEN90_131 [Parcubacteria group bacterium Licking1014_17]
MQIIDVLPLTILPRNQDQILNYYHTEKLERGAVVEVELNKRKVRGVVIGSTDLKSAKLGFKKHVSYELKHIRRVINPKPQVFEWQLRVASFLASYYYAPLGLCVKLVLPPFWGVRGYEMGGENKLPAEKTKIEEKLVIGNALENIEEQIKKYIGKNKQVFLLVPETFSADYFIERFKKYEPVFVTGAVSNKKYYENWKNIASGETKLIVGTRIGLFLPFANLGLIIIDDESNGLYKSEMAPLYNAVDLAGYVVRMRNSDLLLTGIAPRIETLNSFTKETEKSINKEAKIIDMTREIKDKNFSVLSREMKGNVADIAAEKKKMILFVPRKGHANFISCRNCGEAISCKNCSVPLIYYKVPEEKLICHHCDYNEAVPRKCPTCGSFALKAYGVGSSKVVTELNDYLKYFGINNISVIQLDNDTTGYDEEVQSDLVNKFIDADCAILVATQMIFNHRHLIKVPLIGIINADTLAHFPDFRAEERMFCQLMILRDMTDKLLIQTYNPENYAIKAAVGGDADAFFKKELADRKLFSYPPYSRLTKIYLRHRNEKKLAYGAKVLADKLAAVIKQDKKFANIKIDSSLPSFIFKEKGMFKWNIMLEISPYDIYNDKEVTNIRNELFRYMPDIWHVDADPVLTI